MVNYRIVFSSQSLADIDDIIQYVSSIYDFEAGLKFGKKFKERIDSLKNSAGSYTITSKRSILRYHPQARSITTNNGKWTIIFYVEQDVCYIEKIIQSSSIKGKFVTTQVFPLNIFFIITIHWFLISLQSGRTDYHITFRIRTVEA